MAQADFAYELAADAAGFPLAVFSPRLSLICPLSAQLAGRHCWRR